MDRFIILKVSILFCILISFNDNNFDDSKVDVVDKVISQNYDVVEDTIYGNHFEDYVYDHYSSVNQI